MTVTGCCFSHLLSCTESHLSQLSRHCQSSICENCKHTDSHSLSDCRWHKTRKHCTIYRRVSTHTELQLLFVFISLKWQKPDNFWKELNKSCVLSCFCPTNGPGRFFYIESVSRWRYQSCLLLGEPPQNNNTSVSVLLFQVFPLSDT